MNIVIKPCDGINPYNVIDYARSAFCPGKVFDYSKIKEGVRNGVATVFTDGAQAFVYKTKTSYVFKLVKKPGYAERSDEK